MPSSNGVYSLPPGYLATTGGVIQISEHNPIFEDVATALTGRLSRDGTAPMTGALQVAPGTVGLPGAAFASDPTTGFYKTTAGVGVAVGGIKVAEFVAGGVIGARVIGELVPFTGTAVPNSLFVLPFGQTLSRTGQPQLWAFAQTEIAAGNTFYNNGDGSTTFGIGDMRGRVPAAWDKMGGTLASRLTTAGGGVDGSTLGAVGGGQNKILTTPNLPPYTPSGGVSGTSSSLGVTSFGGLAAGAIEFFQPIGSTNNNGNFNLAGTISASFTGNAQGGTSTPVQIMPPVLVTNYILFAGA